MARRMELAARRRAARQRLIGIVVGTLAAVGIGVGAYWWVSASDTTAPEPPSAAAPVRIDLDDLPDDPLPDQDPAGTDADPDLTIPDDQDQTATTRTRLEPPRTAPERPAKTP